MMSIVVTVTASSPAASIMNLVVTSPVDVGFLGLSPLFVGAVQAPLFTVVKYDFSL